MGELLKVLQDVINNAQKLCIQMQNAATYANNITKEADARIKTADSKDLANETKAKELAEREAKVAKIENIAKLAEDGVVLAEQNKKSIAFIEAKEKAFKDEVANSMKKIATEKKEIADEKVKIAKEWDKINKENVALKVAREKIREDIISELKALK